MTDNNYIWVPQRFDCRGGINEEPENAAPNQLLDARNMWCPEGRLEQRPGYVGAWPISFEEDGTLTNAKYVKSVSDVLTSAGVGGPFDISDLASGDYWAIGLSATDLDTDSKFITDVVRFAVELDTKNGTGTTPFIRPRYWNGSEWRFLLVLEESGRDSVTNSREWKKTDAHLQPPDTATVYFSFVIPNDCSLSTIDSNERYWIRFEIYNDDVGNTVLTDGALNLSYANRPALGAGVVQFVVEKMPFALSATDTYSGTGALQYEIGYPEDRVIHIDDGDISPVEPSSWAVVSQFNELFVSTSNKIVELVRRELNSNPEASVETAPEIVGEINGIKSDYHPDYVAALASFPEAKYIEYFQNQLWVANLKDEPFTVRWSAPAPAHKVWPVESFEYLMEDDNSPIIGLKTFGEHIAVFKQDSIWRMVYAGVGGVASVNTYVPVKVPGGIGTVSNASIQDINGVLVFLAEDGIYAFNGADKPTKLTENIDPTISRINKGRRQFASSVHWRSKNCYLLGIPVDGSEANNIVLVYDYKHGSWWIWDNIEAQILFKDEGPSDEEVIYFADNSGRVFRLGEGFTDNGTATTAYFKPHRIGFDSDQSLSIRSVRINAENPGISLSVTVERDDEPSTNALSRTVDFSDGTEYKTDAADALVGTATCAGNGRRTKKSMLRKTGNWHTVKIENTTKNVPMIINNLKIGLSPWSRR